MQIFAKRDCVIAPSDYHCHILIVLTFPVLWCHVPEVWFTFPRVTSPGQSGLQHGVVVCGYPNPPAQDVGSARGSINGSFPPRWVGTKHRQQVAPAGYKLSVHIRVLLLGRNPPAEQDKWNTVHERDGNVYHEEKGEDASFYFQQNGAALICFSTQKLWRWRSLLDYFVQHSLCSFAHCFHPSVEIIFLMESIT